MLLGLRRKFVEDRSPPQRRAPAGVDEAVDHRLQFRNYPGVPEVEVGGFAGIGLQVVELARCVGGVLRQGVLPEFPS